MNIFRFSAAFLLLLLAACTKPSPKESTTAETAAPATPVPARNELPNLPVLLANGERINLKEANGKTILILFQPDCDHCQREATAIQQNIQSFDPYTVYFVSTAFSEELLKFANEYKLNGKPNIHFGTASMDGIVNNFGNISAPSMFIYSDTHSLVKNFNGETAIGEILKAIQ